jgi:hypothetical protein
MRNSPILAEVRHHAGILAISEAVGARFDVVLGPT